MINTTFVESTIENIQIIKKELLNDCGFDIDHENDNKIKFRTISCEESSTDLNELIEIKNNWLTNEINKYMDKINNMVEDYNE